MRAKTLPILLKNQKILLIGGGKVALQKAEVLAKNEIEFKVIAKELDKKIKKTTLNIVVKKFSLKDIQEYKIIIDATGNPKIAKKLLSYKKSHDVLLNVVDMPSLCDFYFMALTKNRPLQIAVSSNGASPTVAKYFRDECEAMLPKDITKYLEKKLQEREEGIINIKQTQAELQKKYAKVFLVGCGLGDAELLTLKAYKIIKSVDVVLYDNLITDEIMDVVPKETKKVYVGKKKDFHSKSQEEINSLIIKYAHKGLKVARLKSGDPFVFGRGAEELHELLKEGIATEVIAGISSSVSGTLMADIPITARGYASGFSIVSAHLKGNNVNLDWVDLLHKENHTVVVLMGLSRIEEIFQEAIRLGVSMQKPCAIVSNASRKNQKVVSGIFQDLRAMACGVERPAVLIFGDVVKLQNILGELR